MSEYDSDEQYEQEWPEIDMRPVWDEERKKETIQYIANTTDDKDKTKCLLEFLDKDIAQIPNKDDKINELLEKQFALQENSENKNAVYFLLNLIEPIDYQEYRTKKSKQQMKNDVVKHLTPKQLVDKIKKEYTPIDLLQEFEQTIDGEDEKKQKELLQVCTQNMDMEGYQWDIRRTLYIMEENEEDKNLQWNMLREYMTRIIQKQCVSVGDEQVGEEVELECNSNNNTNAFENETFATENTFTKEDIENIMASAEYSLKNSYSARGLLASSQRQKYTESVIYLSKIEGFPFDLTLMGDNLKMKKGRKGTIIDIGSVATRLNGMLSFMIALGKEANRGICLKVYQTLENYNSHLEWFVAYHKGVLDEKFAQETNTEPDESMYQAYDKLKKAYAEKAKYYDEKLQSEHKFNQQDRNEIFLHCITMFYCEMVPRRSKEVRLMSHISFQDHRMNYYDGEFIYIYHDKVSNQQGAMDPLLCSQHFKKMMDLLISLNPNNAEAIFCQPNGQMYSATWFIQLTSQAFVSLVGKSLTSRWLRKLSYGYLQKNGFLNDQKNREEYAKLSRNSVNVGARYYSTATEKIGKIQQQFSMTTQRPSPKTIEEEKKNANDEIQGSGAPVSCPSESGGENEQLAIKMRAKKKIYTPEEEKIFVEAYTKTQGKNHKEIVNLCKEKGLDINTTQSFNKARYMKNNKLIGL